VSARDVMRAVVMIVTSVGIGGGCLGAGGARCTIASDCEAGLVCSLEGVCATVAEVAASFDTRQAVDVITRDTSDTSEAEGDVAGCREVVGVFAAGQAPCPTAAEVRVVTGIALADSGHGLAQLASVANQVIADGFDKGEISLALHVDGELRAGCPASLAWMRGAADRHADCTAEFTDAMPFEIPNLVATRVEEASLDPATGRVTGLIDKAALIASMDPALRDVAEQLIVLDVDTDGDQVADMASAILDLTFE